MPQIKNSTKLHTDDQYVVASQGVVFFRIVPDVHGYKMMTATAGEDTDDLKPYASQDSLISATRIVLNDDDHKVGTKKDHMERPYVEARGFLNVSDIETVAAKILISIGIKDIELMAIEEMKQIYSDLSTGDSGEDIYLSDGLYLTKNGEISE